MGSVFGACVGSGHVSASMLVYVSGNVCIPVSFEIVEESAAFLKNLCPPLIRAGHHLILSFCFKLFVSTAPMSGDHAGESGAKARAGRDRP